MSWCYLVAAIFFEVCGTTCMKLSDGFSKSAPSWLMFAFYGISFYAMTIAIKHIEVSVAYAIWSALGTALIAVVGIIWFKESLGALKIISLAIIIVGLNLSTRAH